MDDVLTGLNDAQLNWKIHDKALSIAQMLVHVAGVEVSFTAQLLGLELEGEALTLKGAATEGVVNDLPFPFSPEELTAAKVSELLAYGRSLVEPIITNPSPEILAKEIVSALGPIITGEGAFCRLAFHPAYHHGQAYLILTSPGFPS